MDTILFFYQKRDLAEPLVEPVGMKRYMLIRVGLNVREEEWFGLQLCMRQEDVTEQRDDVREIENTPAGLRGFFMRRKAVRLEKLKRCIAQQQRQQALEEYAARICRTEEAVKKLFEDIWELTDETGIMYCAYENSVRKAFIEDYEDEVKQKRQCMVLSGIWMKYCNAVEFDDYENPFWVGQLLNQAVLNHYVILGRSECIYELLGRYARRIKSLQWLIPEAECDEELLDFTEDFYIEYGLAIELQTFQSMEAFRRLKLAGSRPVNVIDFMDAGYPYRTELAEGSIWLDMLSSDEKKYRLCGRQKGIRYISLKEEWKHVQRRCRTPQGIAEDFAADKLDTDTKSEYNTGESRSTGNKNQEGV